MLTSTVHQTFVPNAHVGVGVDVEELRNENDAIVICTGATWPRDLKIPNRDADGIHFAMEFLQVNYSANFPNYILISSSSTPSLCWIQNTTTTLT